MPNLIYWMCGVRSARRPTCQALTSLAREFRAGCRACRAGRAGTVDLRHVRLDVLGADAVRRREIVASRRRDPIGFAKDHRAFGTFLKFYEAAKDLCDALAEFPDNPDFDRLFRNLDIIAEARANTPDGGKSFFGKFFTATEEEKAVGALGEMLKNIGEGLAHAARTIRPLDKVARYLGASGPGLAKLQAARGAFIEFERAYRAALKAQAMEPAEPGDLIPDHSRQLGRDLLFRDWSGNQDRLVDQDEGAGDPGRSDDLENSKGKGPDGSDAPAEFPVRGATRAGLEGIADVGPAPRCRDMRCKPASAVGLGTTRAARRRRPIVAACAIEEAARGLRPYGPPRHGGAPPARHGGKPQGKHAVGVPCLGCGLPPSGHRAPCLRRDPPDPLGQGRHDA